MNVTLISRAHDIAHPIEGRRMAPIVCLALAGLVATGCEIVGEADVELELLWEHGENEITALTDEEMLLRLGHVEAPGEPTHAEAEAIADDNHAAWQGSGHDVLGSTIDWRDFNGESYVNPVRDQGACGSCVAFATTAVLDSMLRITHSAPLSQSRLPSVSEAQLAFCGQSDICTEGWSPVAAISYMQSTGLTTSDAYPYTAVQQACDMSKIDAAKVSKASGQTTLTDHEAMIEHLQTKGPLVGTFTVYEDFRHYNGGIYHHTGGDVLGGHAVAIIGFGTDQGTNYWVAQNSWGTGWGEDGYFRIGFSEAGIDDRMYAIDWTEGTEAYVDVYEFAADFTDQNPNRVWSYGYGSSGGDFSPSPDYWVRGPVAYRGGGENTDTWRGLYKNLTDQTQIGDASFEPHQTLMHPGNSFNHFSKARFTAPKDGCYDINVTWANVDGMANRTHPMIFTDAAEVNGDIPPGTAADFKQIFADDLDGPGASASFASTVELSTNEILSFELSNGGDGYDHDWVSIALTITKVDCP